MSVSVETADTRDGLLVSLAGELDVASADSVEARLIDIEGAGPERLVIDLRELQFMDSTGLSLLINADRRGRKAGRRVTIVSGTGPSRRILQTVGLDTRLDVVQELPVQRR